MSIESKEETPVTMSQIKKFIRENLVVEFDRDVWDNNYITVKLRFKDEDCSFSQDDIRVD